MLHEDSKTTDRHGALRLALGIAAAYAAFGVAWILLSDAAVSAVSTEPAWLSLAQRYKGRVVFRELPGHSHWLIGEPGWEKIAGEALEWIEDVCAAQPVL